MAACVTGTLRGGGVQGKQPARAEDQYEQLDAVQPSHWSHRPGGHPARDTPLDDPRGLRAPCRRPRMHHLRGPSLYPVYHDNEARRVADQ